MQELSRLAFCTAYNVVGPSSLMAEHRAVHCAHTDVTLIMHDVVHISAAAATQGCCHVWGLFTHCPNQGARQ